MTNHTQIPPAVTPPPTTVPIKKYSAFYFILLLLSMVGTILGLFSLGSIPEYIQLLESNAALAIISFISLLAIPVSVVALILLWQKNIVGLWLKLVAYSISVITAVALLFYSNDLLRIALADATKELATNEQELSLEIVETIVRVGFYVGIITSILISITFALLWWFAWKSQVRHDKESSNE